VNVSKVYVCAYIDYDMWKARFPEKIIYRDPYCPRGVLIRGDGEEQIATEEYWKSRRRDAEIWDYDEEMLADGTGD